MEQGVIFTQDKKDIEVFFLKPQQPKPLIDDSIDSDVNPKYWTGNIFDNPNKLIEEGKAAWVSGCEQDVNENSAGEGAHWHGVCCPAGHKGVKGPIGVAEDEAYIFEVISECLEKFSATDLSVNDSGSRDILSITITRKIKDL